MGRSRSRSPRRKGKHFYCVFTDYLIPDEYFGTLQVFHSLQTAAQSSRLVAKYSVSKKESAGYLVNQKLKV